MIKKISIKNFVIGIDEVGRGPLAGPVTLGICLIYDFSKNKHFLQDIKESKSLSEEKRYIWYKKIISFKKNKILDFQTSSVSAPLIDKFGLSYAINKALKNGLNKILKNVKENEFIQEEEIFKIKILLDGGLKAPENFKNQKTIIKGDEKEISIAIASIVAKVNRDNFMKNISKKYPNYNFEVHKGYGTKKHIEAIKKFGKTPIHRELFLRKIKSL